jgi:outer membrane murein-binding lipoprotein Lpp
MNRAYGVIVAAFVTVVAAWGCSQETAHRAALADRLKAVETKSARLEDDLHSMIAARDAARGQLAKAEETIQKLKQVSAERDQIAAQFEQFRGSIRNLVIDAEATVLRFPNGDPVTVVIGGGSK